MKKTYACSCSPKLLATMREISERNHLSRATVFTTALRHYLNHMVAAGIISPSEVVEEEEIEEEAPLNPRRYAYTEDDDMELFAAEDESDNYGTTR